MSKKPAAAASGSEPGPAQTPVQSVAVTAIPQELVDEAWARFKPFVFTLSSETRDNMDFAVVVAQLQRDASIGPNLVVVDRAEAIHAVASANPHESPDAHFPAVIAEAKANLLTLGDTTATTAAAAALVLTAEQSLVAAQCVKWKIAQAAIAREQARREELRLQHQQHLELVERFIEEGMKPQDAERAALEEEQAAAKQGAGGGAATGGGGLDEDEGGPERPQAFVLVRGYPISPQDVASLARCNVPLHAVLNINSLARFGMKKDEAAAAALAAGGGKGGPGGKKGAAPEAKKVDPKKAGGKAGGLLGGDSLATTTVDPLVLALRREILRLPRLSPGHPFLQSELWTYSLPTHETHAVDEYTGLRVHELSVPEVQIAQTIVERVVQLEMQADRYAAWLAPRTRRGVAKLQTKEDQAAAAAAALAALQDAKAREEAKAAAAPQAKKGGGKPPPKGAAVDEAALQAAKEAEALAMAQQAAAAAAITLARSVQDVTFPAEIYRSLLHVAQQAQLSDVSTIFDALATQVAHHDPDAPMPPKPKAIAGGGISPRSVPNTPRGAKTARNPAEEALVVQSLKQDVADFADFVLAQLDGSQKDVFEAARLRRMHPLAAAAAANASAMDVAPPASVTVDPNGTPAGVLVPPAEGQTLRPEVRTCLLDSLLFKGCDTGSDTTNDTTSLAGVTSACVEALRRSGAVPSATLADVSHLEVLSEVQYASRLQDALLVPDGCPVGTITTLADGAQVVVLAQPAAVMDTSDASSAATAGRRRWANHWHILHGLPSFAQWLRLVEYTEKEVLHYYPLPRDDDGDEQAAALAGGADAEAEEEEDEEEEEEYEDENGEVAVRKIKKEKPKKLYEPEYVDVNAKEQTERRRRNALTHLTKLLQVPVEQEEVIFANNHTATAAYSEEHTMLPDDGSVIVTTDSAVNTSGVQCTVRTVGGASFGFRGSRSVAGSTSSASNAVGSGVRSFLTLGEGGLCVTGDVSIVRKHPATASAPPTLASGATATGATPSGTPRDGTPAGFQPEDFKHVATVVAATHGCSVAVASDAASMTLSKAAVNRQKSLGSLVYLHTAGGSSNGNAEMELTQVGKERHRSILRNGTVVVTHESGSVLHLRGDGSWASTSSSPNGNWLHCGSRGQRLVRPAAHGATVRELPAVLAATRRHPVSGATVTERNDGTTKVDFADGETSAVRHHDGTVFWHFPDRMEVVSPDYPLIVFTKAKATGGAAAGQASAASPFDGPIMAVFANAARTFVAWVPERSVVVGHEPSALQCLFQFDTLRMHVVPTPERPANEYVVDMAFGGLRTVDATTAFHVTPLGRTRCTARDAENPIVPADLTVKHTLEVFVTQREALSPDFSDALHALGHAAYDRALHLAPRIVLADPEAWVTTVPWAVGFASTALTQSSVPQRAKAQAMAAGLGKLLPAASVTASMARPVSSARVFVKLPGGNAPIFEVLSEAQLQLDVRRMLKTADLVRSHVYEMPLGMPTGWSAIGLCLCPRPASGAATAAANDAATDGLLSCAVGQVSAASLGDVTSVGEWTAALTTRPAEASATAQDGSSLVGRTFLVRTSLDSSAAGVSTYDAVWAAHQAVANAVQELAETLPASLRRYVSSTTDPKAAASSGVKSSSSSSSNAMKAAPSSAWSRPSAMDQLRQAAARLQPAATNFWQHTATASNGSTPCLDTEMARNAALKATLRLAKAEQVQAALAADDRKRHPVYPPRQPKAPAPAPAASAAGAVVVPAYVPRHANPSGPDMQRSAGQATAGATTGTGTLPASQRQHSLSKPRLASTPTEVDFGTVMEGFRYTTVLQLTNVSAVSSRFRVAVSPMPGSTTAPTVSGATELRHSTKSAVGSCPWLSLEHPKVGLAPGMSCAVEIEVDGYQPLGNVAVLLTVLFDGGETSVPLRVSTRSGQERPVSQQRSNVRMIGPSPLVYSPGTTATRGGPVPGPQQPQGAEYDSD